MRTYHDDTSKLALGCIRAYTSGERTGGHSELGMALVGVEDCCVMEKWRGSEGDEEGGQRRPPIFICFLTLDASQVRPSTGQTAGQVEACLVNSSDRVPGDPGPPRIRSSGAPHAYPEQLFPTTSSSPSSPAASPHPTRTPIVSRTATSNSLSPALSPDS